MGMLFELLPLLDAWEYQLHQTEVTEVYPGVWGELLPANTERNIVLEEGELGWLLGGGFYVIGDNAELTWLTLRTDDWVWRGQIVGLFNLGQVQRGILAPYITRYDTVNNFYAGNVEFAYPMPYKKEVRITIENPNANAVVIGGVFSTLRIKIEEGMKEMFIASLEKMLGTTGIKEEIAKLKGESK